MGNTPSCAFGFVLGFAAAVQAQEFCSCSPTQFELVLTLNQTCDTNDIATNSGIIGSTCLTAEVDGVPSANEESVRRHLQDDDPIINVQRITFLEFDADGEKMAINNDYSIGGPYSNGAKFNFDSASSQLNTSLPLADQAQKVPGGASLVLYGETQSGKVKRNRIWWTYQLENCRRDTIPVQVNDKVGWVTVSDVASAWPAFCKRAQGNPTIPPDDLSSAPPTLAPANIANPQSPNPNPGESTPITKPNGSTSAPSSGESTLTSIPPTPNGSTPAPTFSTLAMEPTLSPKPTLTMKPTFTMKPKPLVTSKPTKRPTGTKPTCAVAYLISKSSKESASKSSKSTKSCKSAKGNKSWGKPHSMNLDSTAGNGWNKERPNRIFSGASSRIKLHNYNYEVDPTENKNNSKHATFQPFAPAWELFAMFVLAAGLVGWTFRHELFLDLSQEVIATRRATQGDMRDMSDDEEDIEDDVVEGDEDDEEEVSTSEDTEHIGDLVFNRTLQLINRDFDSNEAGDGSSVGFIDDEADELDDHQSPTHLLPERSGLELI